MKQETRTNLAVIGSIVAVIGFFLPWVTIAVPGYSTSVSGVTIARTPGGGYYWFFLAAPLVLGFFAMANGMKSTGGIKSLIKLIHGSHSVVVLYSIYQVVVSGTYKQVLVQTIYQTYGVNIADGLNTSLALGFGAVFLGLLLSGIAVYAPESLALA